MAVVTVIVPTFNRKALLCEALESVFAQTFGSYEVLVIDDGSTDGTEQALARYQDRVRYLWKSNGGEASARNFGLAHCTTEYVAFLDSDDLWDKRFLDVVMEHYGKHPELALIATACTVIPTGERRPAIRQPLLQGALYERLFIRNFITASAVVVRRKSFLACGGFDQALEQATDYDAWLKVATHYPIALINIPLCRWRRHDGNISKRELRHRQLVLEVIERHYDPAKISGASYARRRSGLLSALGRAYLRANDRSNATRCFHDALRLSPWRLRAWRDAFGAALAKNVGRHISSSASKRIKDRRDTAWIGRQIRHRFLPGALILCYHRLGDFAIDPHSLGISVDCFAGQMELLRQQATPVHLSELVARLHRRAIQPGTVAVTFDDGYASVLKLAYPILERLNIPATLFATSGHLGSAREAWSDELEQILLGPGTLPEFLSIKMNGLAFHWHLEESVTYTADAANRDRLWTVHSRRDPTSRHQAYRRLSVHLLPLPETDRRLILDQLFRWAGRAPQLRSTHQFLSADELASFARGTLMEIGSHSESHPLLPTIPTDQQRTEIARSVTALEAIIGRRVGQFAYPYGARSSETIALVKLAGLDCACTTFADAIFSSSDPFQLPRLQIANLQPATFARKLGLPLRLS